MSDYVYKNDPNIAPLPFDDKIVNEYATKKILRIGYLKDEGTFYPSAPAIAGMEKSIKLLKEAGHELIEMNNSLFEKMQRPYARILF